MKITENLTMKKWSWRGSAGTLILLGLPLLCAVAWAAEKLMVVEKEAAIRRDKRTYSPRVGTVTEGKEVTVIERDPPWIKIEYGGVQGWLNESSVTEDRDIVLSTSATARGVKATEQSAAGRGFTPEVEKKYREANPNLDGAFKFLDQVEKTKVPDDKILKFIEDGKLSGQAAGGDK